MGDNGETKQAAPEIVEMRISANQAGAINVSFPLLGDKVATYGFLKMGEKALDDYYANQKSKIIKPKGGMMNFVRSKK